MGLESGTILQDGFLPLSAAISYPLTFQRPLGLWLLTASREGNVLTSFGVSGDGRPGDGQFRQNLCASRDAWSSDRGQHRRSAPGRKKDGAARPRLALAALFSL